MPSSTRGPASKKPELRQAHSVGWVWPRLRPIPAKHPLASVAGPPTASQSEPASSKRSYMSTSPRGSQSLRSPSQITLPPSPISPTQISLPPSPISPSQIALPPSPISSKTPGEKSRDSEIALTMDSSAPVASTVAADGSRRKSMMEKLTDSFRMTDQAKEEPISGRTRAREASAEGLSSAETNLSSWRRAIMASREQHNAMEDAWPYTSTPMSEAAIPVAAPTLAKAPTPVESAMKADESTPMEGGSPVERRWIIDTPSHSEEPFGVNFHSPVKEFVQPPSASPITSLPPPRITFQRATEDTEAREGFSAATGAESFNATEDVEHRESIPAATMAETLNATENMERREAVPADNLAETLNGLPGTSHPADVTNVLPEPS